MRKFIVAIWEHDRFSGVKLDSRRAFSHKRSAVRFVKKHNSVNNKKKVPECYWKAELESDHIQYIRKGWMDAEDSGYKGPGWYFWDETQSNCYGPYKNANRAHMHKMKYCRAHNL